MLTNDELERLDYLLVEYGNENDDSLYSVSDLDGFLTAIVSSPMLILPSQWVSRIWANEPPLFDSEEIFSEFMDLVFRLYNSVIHRLDAGKEHYFALFGLNETKEGTYYVVEDWCFGYKFGLELANWQAIPDEVKSNLARILAQTDLTSLPPKCTAKESEAEAMEIERIALKIYEYNKAHYRSV